MKLYQKNYEIIRDVNEVFVQASQDAGACYGVSKYAETVFKRENLVREVGLEVLEETMKTIYPDKNEIDNFLGIKAADGIKSKKFFE